MIHFITYGNHNYTNAKKRICDEARSVGWFDTITSYGPEDLDLEFQNKFKDILVRPRGGGYWIWKPYIIKKHLEKIDDNDILIYMDAGCTINPSGIDRFKEYMEMLNNSDNGCISFDTCHQEKKLTNKEIFDYFNVDINSDIANSGQICATNIILKKDIYSINIVDLWFKTLHVNPLLFTDDYNNNPCNRERPEYIETRHDQSVFSIIRKLYGIILLGQEDWFSDFGSEHSLKFPLWATRKGKEDEEDEN
jgi:hypothetical protein